MQAFFEDGRTTISLREVIKPFVMERKNSLFAITHDGAEITCGYYSIVRTAQFNGLVPYDISLTLFLRKIAKMPQCYLSSTFTGKKIAVKQ